MLSRVLDGSNIITRQMNIDYAVCESLKQMSKIKRVLSIYDIACQWYTHFRQRVKENPYLTVPKALEILPAVGKFHLGAHVLECFRNFSLNFVLGAGQIDGEILETLWWPIDKVAGSTRTMSRHHRREVLDDNMFNSNWKKWIRIGMLTFKHIQVNC
jgi:hypothetical protein